MGEIQYIHTFLEEHSSKLQGYEVQPNSFEKSRCLEYDLFVQNWNGKGKELW